MKLPHPRFSAPCLGFSQPNQAPKFGSQQSVLSQMFLVRLLTTSSSLCLRERLLALASKQGHRCHSIPRHLRFNVSPPPHRPGSSSPLPLLFSGWPGSTPVSLSSLFRTSQEAPCPFSLLFSLSLFFAPSWGLLLVHEMQETPCSGSASGGPSRLRPPLRTFFLHGRLRLRQPRLWTSLDSSGFPMTATALDSSAASGLPASASGVHVHIGPGSQRCAPDSMDPSFPLSGSPCPSSATFWLPAPATFSLPSTWLLYQAPKISWLKPFACAWKNKRPPASASRELFSSPSLLRWPPGSPFPSLLPHVGSRTCIRVGLGRLRPLRPRASAPASASPPPAPASASSICSRVSLFRTSRGPSPSLLFRVGLG